MGYERLFETIESRGFRERWRWRGKDKSGYEYPLSRHRRATDAWDGPSPGATGGVAQLTTPCCDLLQLYNIDETTTSCHNYAYYISVEDNLSRWHTPLYHQGLDDEIETHTQTWRQHQTPAYPFSTAVVSLLANGRRLPMTRHLMSMSRPQARSLLK